MKQNEYVNVKHSCMWVSLADYVWKIKLFAIAVGANDKKYIENYVTKIIFWH